jgi:hypothetical protein
LKHVIVLTPEQTLNFFKIPENDRIGAVIETKNTLSSGDNYSFGGVVKSYSMGYGSVTLICEGEVYYAEAKVK